MLHSDHRSIENLTTFNISDGFILYEKVVWLFQLICTVAIGAAFIAFSLVGELITGCAVEAFLTKCVGS